MLAITGGKGGCGKTTTTLGLAAAMARQGAHPLVVDADCDMPNVHHRLGMDRAPGIDAVADGERLQTAVRQPEQLSGVSVLAGGRRENLGVALRRASNWSGPVILDCAAGATAAALRPVRHASRALLVSTDSPQCLDDTERTLTAVRKLGATPVGVLVRNTESGSDHRNLGGIPTQIPVRSVDTPLEDSRVRTVLNSISRTII